MQKLIDDKYKKKMDITYVKEQINEYQLELQAYWIEHFQTSSMHLHLMYLLIHKPICNQLGCQNQI
jgi:hypothetical protein